MKKVNARIFFKYMRKNYKEDDVSTLLHVMIKSKSKMKTKHIS